MIAKMASFLFALRGGDCQSSVSDNREMTGLAESQRDVEPFVKARFRGAWLSRASPVEVGCRLKSFSSGSRLSYQELL